MLSIQEWKGYEASHFRLSNHNDSNEFSFQNQMKLSDNNVGREKSLISLFPMYSFNNLTQTI